MKKDKEFDYFIRKFVKALLLVVDYDTENIFEGIAEDGVIESRDKKDISIENMNVKSDNEFYMKIKKNKNQLREYFKKDIGTQEEMEHLFDVFINVFIKTLK